MIPRYARPDMVAVWSPETKFRLWYEIEAHACDAQAELGVIPKEAAAQVWTAKDMTFDIERAQQVAAAGGELGNLYGNNRQQLDDGSIGEQSVAVLATSANITTKLEGTHADPQSGRPEGLPRLARMARSTTTSLVLLQELSACSLQPAALTTTSKGPWLTTRWSMSSLPWPTRIERG